MRILHVIPGLTRERGGPSAALEALTVRQAAAGHRVSVLATDAGIRNGEQPQPLAAAVRLEIVAVAGPDRLSYAPGFARRTRRLLSGHDIVHVHSIFTYPVHAALCAAASAGIPAVLRPCGMLHKYSLGRSNWRKRMYLACFGPMLRRAVRAWHYTSRNEADGSWPSGARQAFVLGLGVDAVNDAAEAARVRLGRTRPGLGNSPYVLFLGRLHPKKRPDLLLEAFLAAAPPGWNLVFCGPDESGLGAEMLRRLSEPARRRVFWLGPVAGRDKADLLAAADLFALPSEHENFGVAALEALAAGTPAVLSPHVDVGEAAAAEGLAEIIPVDLTAWTRRMAALPADPKPDPAARDRARRWAAERHSWDHIALHLERRYEWVLAGCPAGFDENLAAETGTRTCAASPAS